MSLGSVSYIQVVHFFNVESSPNGHNVNMFVSLKHILMLLSEWKLDSIIMFQVGSSGSSGGHIRDNIDTNVHCVSCHVMTCATLEVCQ